MFTVGDGGVGRDGGVVGGVRGLTSRGRATFFVKLFSVIGAPMTNAWIVLTFAICCCCNSAIVFVVFVCATPFELPGLFLFNIDGLKFSYKKISINVNSPKAILSFCRALPNDCRSCISCCSRCFFLYKLCFDFKNGLVHLFSLFSLNFAPYSLRE